MQFQDNNRKSPDSFRTITGQFRSYHLKTDAYPRPPKVGGFGTDAILYSKIIVGSDLLHGSVRVCRVPRNEGGFTACTVF